MKGGLRQLSLWGANFFLLSSLYVFATGFFPHKPILSGLASYDAVEDANIPVAPFDKVVFMVVDALRSDFVYSNKSGFEYTQSLIRDGSAMPFTSHAQSPTVTMPRVKALTTGSIPSFLDLVLNILQTGNSSSLAAQDTWIAQMKEKATGKLALYGDDTWLTLFPDTFDRSDGTSSFFVSDYTEVDLNVTRHVPDQLEAEDWSVIVMHYLGLDHIGHKSGSSSVNMLPKQREMDEVVKQIFMAIQTKPHLQDTLLVMTGDHGMTNAGNHGGSAPGETSPATVFVSPKLQTCNQARQSPVDAHEDFQYYTVMAQNDIVPTLAGLLGFPIPLNNLGVFVPDLLSLWPSEEDRVQLMYQNARQLHRIARETFQPSQSTSRDEDPRNLSDELDLLWSKARQASESTEHTVDVRQEQIVKYCREAQSAISSIATNYDSVRLGQGITFAIISIAMSVPFVLQTITRSSSSSYLVIVSILFVVTMFASSYVEEEHQFWFWVSTAWVNGSFLLSGSRTRAQTLLVVMANAVLRLVYIWNQSGQKYADAWDLSQYFHDHPLALMTTCAIFYTVLRLRITVSIAQVRVNLTTFGIGLALSFCIMFPLVSFKLFFTFKDAPELFDEGMSNHLRWLASFSYFSDLERLCQQVWWGCLAALIAIVVFSIQARDGLAARMRGPTQRNALKTIMVVLLANQARATNVGMMLLFPFVWATAAAVNDFSGPMISLWTILAAHLTFFGFGGTNGISSIDLSNGYNGVRSYNPVPVGILTFVSNWIGPIHFSITALCMQLDLPIDYHAARSPPGKPAPLPAHMPSKWHHYTEHVGRLTFFMAMAVFGVEAACTALREHLFVWTVFSPKLLYVGAWVVGWHLGVNVLVGGLITLLTA